MSGASKVMYSIANFFTWLIVIGCVAGIVLFPLIMTGILENTTGSSNSELLGYIIYLGIVLFFCIISITMVRMAKKNGTSKGWDFLFIVIGILSGNIFYLLGGIFGMIASK